MEPIISLTNISRKFQIGNETVHAIKSVSLQINKNEYVALMGPSGSGKSTLMNILGCLDTPSGGNYVLNGTDVSKLEDNELAEIRNKEIGFVFQTFNFGGQGHCAALLYQTVHSCFSPLLFFVYRGEEWRRRRIR